MAEPPTTRARRHGCGPAWFVFAVLWGGFPLFFCSGMWVIRLFNGPRDEPPLVRQFKENRDDFEGFVVHYRTLEPGAGYLYPKSFDAGGWGYENGHYPRVTLEGDCVLLDWRWGPPASYDEYLIHSPRGLEGIPVKYRESAWGDGSLKYRLTPIDETWFYLLEP